MLAIGVILADTHYAEYTKELVPSFLLIKVGLGQMILGVIAGSLLTIDHDYVLHDNGGFDDLLLPIFPPDAA